MVNAGTSGSTGLRPIYARVVKTIDRRASEQEVSRIVNQVIETGEDVKGWLHGKALLVSPAPAEETTQECWDRLARTGHVQLKQHDPALDKLPA